MLFKQHSSVSPGHREAAENGGTVMIAATSCEPEAKRWRNAPNHCQLLKVQVSEIWLLSLLSVCRILMRQVSAWPGSKTEKSIFLKTQNENQIEVCTCPFINALLFWLYQNSIHASCTGKCRCPRAYFWIPFSMSRWATCVNTAGEPLEQRPAQ